MDIKIIKQRFSEDKVFVSEDIYKLLENCSEAEALFNQNFSHFRGLEILVDKMMDNWTIYVPDEVYFNKQQSMRKEQLDLAMENLKDLFR